ncbi:hypothetical protein [Rhodopirellula bahusiensis]
MRNGPSRARAVSDPNHAADKSDQDAAAQPSKGRNNYMSNDEQQSSDCPPIFRAGKLPAVSPSPNQPGTLGQQLAAVSVSLYLAERRGQTAAEVWDDARRLVIPHASGGLCK